jgi:hypothetical protein
MAGLTSKKNMSKFLAFSSGQQATDSLPFLSIHQLMRTCCEEAVQYGDVKAPVSVPLPKVTVLINPSANRRASEEAVSSITIKFT